MSTDSTTILVGYKQTEVGVIPEDWEVKQLNDLCSEIKRGASPRPITNPKWFDNNSQIGWVRISDATSAKRYLLETKQKLSKEGVQRSRYIPKGNLIMSICATVGRPIQTQIDVCIHDGFVIFESIFIDQNFLYYVLCDLEPRWSDKGQTGSQMNLNTELIKSTEIPLPSDLSEQKTIAEVLSDMDALIHKLQILVNKKHCVKQGTMQELLTGKTRLDGYNTEWAESPLKEICNIIRGSQISRNKVIYGQIPVIAGGKEPSCYHNQFNRSGITITISGSGANAGYVAIHANPIFASDCSTISESTSYDIWFVYYLMKLMQNEIYNLQTGGAQPHVYPIHIEPLIVNLPIDVEEQESIGKILFDMDAEITALEERLEKAKAIKQGMMQQLLTGKIRLVD